MGKIDIDISNYKKVIDDLQTQMGTAPRKVLESTMKDFKTRAPSWISQETRKIYGVGKSGIEDPKVQGEGMGVKLQYKGRMHTPLRFGMKPTSPPDGAYTLKATILKGSRATLGKTKKLTKKQKKNIGRNFTHQSTKTSKKSPIMLMRATGGQYLPFQRVSANRHDIKAVKVLSTAQMVYGKRTQPLVDKAINDKLGKRLAHYMDRYMR